MTSHMGEKSAFQAYNGDTGQVDFWLLPRKISAINDEIASLFILVLPGRNAYKEFQDQEIRIEYNGTLSGDSIEFTCGVGKFAVGEFVTKHAKQHRP